MVEVFNQNLRSVHLAVVGRKNGFTPLISYSPYFFEYEASFLLKISSRTLRRYIREINETHVLSKHGKGLESFSQNGFRSYHDNLGFFNKETDPFKMPLIPKLYCYQLAFVKNILKV